MSVSSKNRRTRGFSLIEVIIATAILLIGVSAMAMLAAVMLTRGRQAKYMNLAATLASEKLEDLNRWGANAPQICVPSPQVTEGGLVTNPANGVTASITCVSGQTPAPISYFDQVNINFVDNAALCASVSGGCYAETISSVTNGATTYYTTFHSPTGIIPGGGSSDGMTPFSSSTAPSNMTFLRSWYIESDTPVSGVKRVTVLVTLLDQSVKPAVSFQMSLVRP